MALTKRDGRFLGWHHEEEIAAGDTGAAVPIPPMVAGQKISVRTIAGSNAAKVQSTISSDAKVAAGTATWEDWPPGAQMGTVSAQLDGPVTALRGVASSSASSAVTFEILI